MRIEQIKIEASNWFDGSRMISQVKYWFERDDGKGFYHWDGLKYVLFEYEQELYKEHFTANSGKTPLLWSTVAKEKLLESIEHIYPQTPVDDSWKDAFGGENVISQ